MSKSAIVAVVIAVIVIAGGGALLAMHNSSDDTTSNSSMSNMNMNDDSSSNSTQKTATNSVTIEGFAFSPADITVKKGTAVTWTNKDGTTHTVTESDGQTGPDSGNLADSKSYSFTYDTVGTFKYHCTLHSNMTGTVTVTE